MPASKGMNVQPIDNRNVWLIRQCIKDSRTSTASPLSFDYTADIGTGAKATSKPQPPGLSMNLSPMDIGTVLNRRANGKRIRPVP